MTQSPASDATPICLQSKVIPGQFSLKFLHGLVALGIKFDLSLDEIVEMPEVVGLDGAESLHQQLGDLHLLVVLGLGDAKFVLGLSTIEQSVLVGNLRLSDLEATEEFGKMICGTF